jgi:hypothetical protein
MVETTVTFYMKDDSVTALLAGHAILSQIQVQIRSEWKLISGVLLNGNMMHTMVTTQEIRYPSGPFSFMGC